MGEIWTDAIDKHAICPMCVGRITIPGVPADCCNAFDSDEDNSDPLKG